MDRTAADLFPWNKNIFARLDVIIKVPHHVVAICFDVFKTMPLSPLVVRESLIIIIVVVMASDKRHIWVQRQIISCLQTFTFLPRSYFFFHKDDISFQLTINQLQLVHCYTIFHLRSGLCTVQYRDHLVGQLTIPDTRMCHFFHLSFDILALPSFEKLCTIPLHPFGSVHHSQDPSNLVAFEINFKLDH